MTNDKLSSCDLDRTHIPRRTSSRDEKKTMLQFDGLPITIQVLAVRNRAYKSTKSPCGDWF
jgi:hypothetical protein